MQYTGESYSEGLQSIADTLTKETGEGSAVPPQEIFPSAHAFNIGHKDRIDTLFAAWWVELLHRINIQGQSLRPLRAGLPGSRVPALASKSDLT